MEPTTQPPDPHLNDCGKCGSPAIFKEQALMPTEQWSAEHIAHCGTCSNRGDWKTDKWEAAQVWNSRNRQR